jgi:ABC-type oligopeptide transport system substrate-binding subunit
MLKTNETENNQVNIDKEILSLVDFRKALSLSIDRVDYSSKCTTASLKGFGLFNSMHYYDVANGGVFRETDEAKKVLCEIYNVDWTDTAKYPTLDDAVNAITGYDLDAAKALFTSAYNTALEQGLLDADDTVKLTFGSGAINESVQRHYDYLTSAWKKAVEGTPLEGKLDFELKDFATAWSNDFRAGKYEICMGGWSGAAWDPGYFLLAYLDKGYMYSAAWDTTKAMMTFTMKGVGENGEDITETMSLHAWYDCLNGASNAKYDWSSSALEESQRLQLIAALEKEILKVYYTVPTYNSFGASLHSRKFDYITYEYNTFMGYGGIKYMTFNYDDAEWHKYVQSQNGQLNYK